MNKVATEAMIEINPQMQGTIIPPFLTSSGSSNICGSSLEDSAILSEAFSGASSSITIGLVA